MFANDAKPSIRFPPTRSQLSATTHCSLSTVVSTGVVDGRNIQK